jgi:hypothetical protein
VRLLLWLFGVVRSALLREGSGVEFDARCVEALERVLAQEHSARLGVAV